MMDANIEFARNVFNILQQQVNMLQTLLLLLQTFRLQLRRRVLDKPDRPGAYCIVNRQQQMIGGFLNGNLNVKKHLRIERRTFNLLESRLARHTHGWDLAFRLMVFLYWLGCGTAYRVISQVFNIPQSSICDIVNALRDEILDKFLADVIKFPAPNELKEVGAGFARLAGSPAFRNAVGALDGRHVRVKVTGANKIDYYNRKCDYSIQLQAVVDHKGKFLNVCAGYPGSVRDSRVLRASTMYMKRLYPPAGYFLLADGGYPLIEQPICVITPYSNPHPDARVENNYNAVHGRARSVVERAFGKLKARWRAIFTKVLEINHTKAARLVTVCAILHNMCIALGDNVMPYTSEDEDDDNEDYDVDELEFEKDATQLRDHLARKLSIPEDTVMQRV